MNRPLRSVNIALAALARERIFEFYAQTQATRVTLLRLNYAVELRYGVLLEIEKRAETVRPSIWPPVT